jgi:hypothetical protein
MSVTDDVHLICPYCGYKNTVGYGTADVHGGRMACFDPECHKTFRVDITTERWFRTDKLKENDDE